MEKLKEAVEADLGITKAIKIVESNLHTFVFEVDKKSGDDGMRKSN